MGKKLKPGETETLWVCECGYDMHSARALQKHLKEVHGVTETKGSRESAMFLDGSKGYTNSYNWVIGGVKIYQTITGCRGLKDPMRHG